MSPIAMLATGPTKPLAGVIATRPHTAPVAVAIALGFLFSAQLRVIQVRAAAAAAVLVVTKALRESGDAARALPALKPNQPNQRSAAPRSTNGTLFASINWPCLWSTLRPMTSAAARPAKPALIWTT